MPDAPTGRVTVRIWANTENECYVNPPNTDEFTEYVLASCRAVPCGCEEGGYPTGQLDMNGNEVMRPCPSCEPCGRCDGTGARESATVRNYDTTDSFQESYKCDACSVCKGTGRRRKPDENCGCVACRSALARTTLEQFQRWHAATPWPPGEFAHQVAAWIESVAAALRGSGGE